MSITPTTSTGAAGLPAVINGQEVTQGAFLELLIVQLQNQDPLDPMDNQTMLAQLAQFSTLEETQNLNQTMGMNVAATEAINSAVATSLIGKEVKAVGNTVTFDGEHPVDLEFHLPGSGTYTVKVLDADGRVVASHTEEGDPGFGSWTWNGATDAGGIADEGTYQLQVTQADAEGNLHDATTFFTGRVDGVRYENGITWLSVDGQRVLLGDVLEINAPAAE